MALDYIIMVGVWCVYGGAVLALLGALVLFRPLPMPGLPARRRGALLAAVGFALSGIGFVLPAPDRRAADRRSQLDEFVPVFQFNEVHRIHVDAPPDRVFASIKAVTAPEILLLRTLTWLRRFGRPGPESILNAPERLPILDVATKTGFLPLAEAPNREILVGTVVMAPRGLGGERTPEWFKALAAPGVAKAAMSFFVEPDGSGGAWVTTETRVAATDAGARRRFAVYWRVIYPGSAIIRRMWLRAVKRRAETG